MIVPPRPRRRLLTWLRSVIGEVCVDWQLRKMQDMIAKMQAEMAKQGTSAANGGEAVQPTANGSTGAAQGSAH